MEETQVWSLGQENPLEKGMATHCSILAWRIPCTEEPDGLQPLGLQRVGHDWAWAQSQLQMCSVSVWSRTEIPWSTASWLMMHLQCVLQINYSLACHPAGLPSGPSNLHGFSILLGNHPWEGCMWFWFSWGKSNLPDRGPAWKPHWVKFHRL